MTQQNERAEASVPAWMQTASLLAHQLHRIGWRSPNDAQWDQLHDRVWAPLATALRSPVVGQQAQPITPEDAAFATYAHVRRLVETCTAVEARRFWENETDRVRDIYREEVRRLLVSSNDGSGESDAES